MTRVTASTRGERGLVLVYVSVLGMLMMLIVNVQVLVMQRRMGMQ